MSVGGDRELRVWFPPLRVLLLHDTGVDSAVFRLSREGIVKSVATKGGVLIVTYAGLRHVVVVVGRGVSWSHPCVRTRSR